jgi:subtilisin family serine protease
VKRIIKDNNKTDYKKIISLFLIYGLLFYVLVNLLPHFNMVNAQGKLISNADVGLAKSNQTFKGLGQVGAIPAGQPIPDQYKINIENKKGLNRTADYLKENQLGVLSVNPNDNSIVIKIPPSISKPSTSGLGTNQSQPTTIGDMIRIAKPDKLATSGLPIISKSFNVSKPVSKATETEICRSFKGNRTVTGCKQDIAGELSSISSPSYNLDRIGAYDPGGGSSVKPFWTRSLDLSNAPIVIYVMDSGVNPHTDLNVIGNVTFIKDLKDPINNVLVNNSEDRDNHGTHVAGIAAAKDNSIGTIGVAPGAKIFSLKVIDRSGTSWTIGGEGTFGSALDYIVNHAIKDKIKLVNLSINLGQNSTELEKKVKQAVDEGVTFIAAAGNADPGSGRPPRDVKNTWPGSDPNVIVVGSMADSDGKCGAKGNDIKVVSDHAYTSYIDKDDGFSSFSNYGPKVDFVAPGDNINSTDSDGKGYLLESGTSMAAPHVTGAAALFLSTHPDASPARVKSALQNGSSSLLNCNADGSGPFTDKDPSKLHHPILYSKTLLPPS